MNINERERDAIEEGFIKVVSDLYRNLFDYIATHPDEDPKAAGQRFKNGLVGARKARTVALENL